MQPQPQPQHHNQKMFNRYLNIKINKYKLSPNALNLSNLIDALKQYKIRSDEKMKIRVHIVNEGVRPGDEENNLFITYDDEMTILKPSENTLIEIDDEKSKLVYMSISPPTDKPF